MATHFIEEQYVVSINSPLPEAVKGLVTTGLLNQLSVASFLFFQVLFHRVSPWLSAHLSPGFLKLSSKQKMEWHSRTTSTVHALVTGLFCLYILFFDNAIKQDPVWDNRGDSTWVKTSISVTTGYIVSDLLLIIYYWKAIGDRNFVLHHGVVLYGCYFILGYGMLPYFATLRLLAEFSTPCVNQRWFFEVLGYPKCSTASMANGVMMAAVFFMVRIAVIPVYYGYMYSVYGSKGFYRLSYSARLAWITSSIFLDIMNVVWMHKIARGCWKVLFFTWQQKPQVVANGKEE